MLEDFHFLRPLWLLLLAVPVFGYRYFFANISTSSSWEGVCDKNLLDFLLIKGSSHQRSTLVYLIIAGLVGATISLAGPTWEKREIPTFAPENPLMILLNLSTDMEATDVTPSRLMRAKYSVDDLLKQLPNTQTGLIVYSNEPYMVSPITADHKILSNLLSAVDYNIMPDNGDKLGRAIAMAVEKMQNSGYKRGNIVVFSADVGQDFNAALKSASEAKDRGYKVSVFEVNSQKNDKLKMLAQKGDGAYLQVSKNNQSVNKMAEFIMAEQNNELKKGDNNQEQWLDFGYYLLVLPLLCCAYFFRRGILAATIVLFFMSNANAGFLLNNNQEAARAFKAADFNQAAEKFAIPEWKASSYYRAGDYKEAYKYFSQKNDPESLYNQGNALAKSGDVEGAIGKYEEALKQNPQHEDAKFNLEYLKQQQQNQQQNQDNNSDEDKNEDKEKQNSQGNQNQQENKEDNPEQDKQQGDDKKEESGAEKKSDNSEQKDNPKDEKEQNAKMQVEDKKEAQNQQATSAEQQENQEQYDEKMQALEQQYRDIPEDAGGLLRAFIRKEYIKNRYKENGR